MGVFYVDAEIVNIRRSARRVTVSKLLVDSGSEYTWVPEENLKKARIEIVKKDIPFVMANGQTITRSIGYAIVRASGFETIDEVVFAQSGDLSLLGSRTLEGFGAMIDARRKRLVAGGPHPAASAVAVVDAPLRDWNTKRRPRSNVRHG
jgi:predicted aspartyl protease